MGCTGEKAAEVQAVCMSRDYTTCPEARGPPKSVRRVMQPPGRASGGAGCPVRPKQGSCMKCEPTPCALAPAKVCLQLTPEINSRENDGVSFRGRPWRKGPGI